MKRLLIAFLFWIVGSALIYFTGIQLVSLVIYKSYRLCFDYRYLFFQGNINYFLCLTLLSLAAPIYVLLGYGFSKFGTDAKYDKKDYSKMSTKRDIKKNMICVSFDNNGTIYLTLLDKVKIMLNKIPQKLNDILKKLKLSNIFKFKTLNQWKIGNETVYKRSGLPFITKYGKVWLDPSPSHNLIVGTTNSGKSYSIILPMLIMMAMSGESGVAIDIKGELSEMTADFFKKKGYKIYFLDFLDTQNSDCWNPLELGLKEYIIQKEIEDRELNEINKKIENEREKHNILNGNSGIEFNIKTCLGKNEAGDYIYDEKTGKFLTSANYGYSQELFRDVVEAITVDKKSNSNDSFWNDEAGRVLEGYVHLLVESGQFNCVNIPSIARTILEGDEIYRSIGKEKISYIKQYVSEYRNANHLSKEKLMSYIDSAENTRKSTRNVLAKHLNSILTNDDVKKILSSNTINLENIGKEKTIIYLKVHDEKQTYYPLVTLFIKQLWQSLVKQARNSPSKSLDIPFNIIFDEMGQFPKFDEIINVLTAGRSRGVRLTSVVQGFDQLESKYGEKEARTIKNNVMNTVYLLSGDQNTLEELSKRCGTKVVYENKKNTEKRNLTVDRLKDFKLGEALILRQRMGAFITKLRPFNKYKYYPSLEKYKLEDKPKRNPAYFDIAEEIRKKQMKH